MPKRSGSTSTASQRSETTRSHKRAKVDETEANSTPTPEEPEENHEEICEENHKPILKEDAKKNGKKVTIIRDPMYYFEDGNLTLRVGQVLFKVHSSLLKAHSEHFLIKLNPSSQVDVPGGTSDEDAIIVPDTQPSQLRQLMKVIYCLPSNNVVFGDNDFLVGNFECYLNVALLSRKLDMQAMQQWAEKKLADLAHRSGKLLADQLNIFDDKARDSDNYIYLKDVPSAKGDPGSYNAFIFMEAIQYARAVSHHNLLHDMLSILEYYSALSEPDLTYFIAFFRIGDLRKTDSSLFGFFFILLLNVGNRVWVDKAFTQEERMALFSAQSFLTPLPESLKTSIFAPVFARPANANEFAAILSETNNCKEDVFAQWLLAFPTDYYNGVNSREFLVSIKALTTLPFHRLKFITGVSRICSTCRQ
ncbi:BTB/POZ domain protein [Rhizoctonia solani AG-3 Rhs1AP]|uniref:BTB/POZ domain protein n=1 Tax=Rhizoctonia solani AG-3 Rhs1AP TaxID=1086054 RepID=X8J0P8_9AGAM|nr:BTB/POZ domain protein [Rhizoctonia solani AG-3 Rhs1AP]